MQLSNGDVRAIMPALEGAIETWRDADCGENQAKNDAWVRRLEALLSRMEAEVPRRPGERRS